MNKEKENNTHTQNPNKIEIVEKTWKERNNENKMNGSNDNELWLNKLTLYAINFYLISRAHYPADVVSIWIVLSAMVNGNDICMTTKPQIILE